MRGEWIEISNSSPLYRGIVSLPMRGEWIEIGSNSALPPLLKSLPMRGEWIEISVRGRISGSARVSPHAGRVD